MRPPFENLREGSLRSAWFTLPAVCVLVSTVGVISFPASGLVGAERALEEVRARALDCARQRHDFEAFQAGSGVALLEQAEEHIARRLPPAMGELELGTAVQLLAARFGLELSGLHLGPPEPSRAGALVGARPLELRGTATLSGWNDFVEGLRALGQPCSVDGFSFARRGASETRFEGHLRLALHHRERDDAPPTTDPGDGS